MEEIRYIGEHILPGRLGNAFVLLSMVAALLSAFAYFRSEKDPGGGWLSFGRWAYRIHSVATFGIIATLFYMITSRFYEYYYVAEHMNNTMPWQFILSAFWEGQEGSFMLWAFWNVILGNILIHTSRNWEAPVVGTFAVVQAFIASMLVGVYFGDFQFGASPFALLREMPAGVGSPMFAFEDYLQRFERFSDGKGLNPLLQNYWNTIHPPTLFLGFASTLVPFAFAIGGLWRKDFTGWMAQAIPWSYFSIMILGTGILMGGAWAYEALGFGGFWAWDPVENSSLVPWITLVGGAHLMLINRRRQSSLFTCFLLVMATFLLVLYSTFLTRSGVLGDSSVHSFVETGILPQLYFYYLFFIAGTVTLMLQTRKLRLMYIGSCILTFILVLVLQDSLPMTITSLFIFQSVIWGVVAYSKFPRVPDEDQLWSREFWMFVGSLVLMLSAIHISIKTSFPIFNKILAELGFTQIIAEPENIAASYHKVQVPIAILICVLMAVTHYFKYKKTDFRKFIRQMTWSFAAAFLLTAGVIYAVGFDGVHWTVYALLGAAVFAVAANADYALRILKGKLNFSGANVAHVGFGLLLIGAVVSTSQQDFISENVLGNVEDLSSDFNNQEFLAIYQGDTTNMGEYFVVYKDKSWSEDSVHFRVNVDYFESDPRTYKQGDLVLKKQALFICAEEHVASDNFLKDFEKWSEVPFPNDRQVRAARPWANGKPGDFLFTLHPSLIKNDNRGQTSREPSIKHYMGRDVYTYLSYVDTEDPVIDERGYLPARPHTLQVGQGILVSGTIISVDSVVAITEGRPEILQGEDTFNIYCSVNRDGKSEVFALPYISLRGQVIAEDLILDEWGLKFKMQNFVKERSELSMTIAEHESTARDFIVMNAIIFPWINVLWLGCLIMVIGTVIAIIHRVREFKRRSAARG